MKKKKETLWETIQAKFFNSKFGVGLIILSILLAFLFKLYDYNRTLSTDTKKQSAENEIEKSNKDLLFLNSKITTLVDNVDTGIDSVSSVLQKYMAIRYSVENNLKPAIKESEFSLKEKLFAFVYKNYKIIEHDNNSNVSKNTRLLLKPLCNQVLDFCKRTDVCSDAHIHAIKLTLDDLDKN
jgi:hypothetical protein